VLAPALEHCLRVAYVCLHHPPLPLETICANSALLYTDLDDILAFKLPNSSIGPNSPSQIPPGDHTHKKRRNQKMTQQMFWKHACAVCGGQRKEEKKQVCEERSGGSSNKEVCGCLPNVLWDMAGSEMRLLWDL